jgi:formylglycine-generating enzyme required for sulfatase activity
MTVALIPPGSFLMGSPESEEGRDRNEGPQHRVTLTKGFFLGIFPVTQEQWLQVIGRNPSHHKGEKNLPVEMVTWNKCQEFCQKLGELCGEPVRLPTEAEWEYACRAGTSSPYSFGDTISAEQANCDFGRQTITPVGTFPPNSWGLFEMHGNVGEWCEDGLREYQAIPAENPKGLVPTNGDRALRVGCASAYPRHCRSASRCYGPVNFPGTYLGLRVLVAR